MAEVDLGRQRSPEHESGEHMVKYLRSANVGDGIVLTDDVKTMNFTPSEQKTFALRNGDVLVTEGSGSRDTVGQSAVWRDDLPGVICFQNTLLRIRPRPGVADGRYLAWWARHAHAARLMAAVASGANILHLSAEELRRLPVPAIDLPTQQRIANFLDDQVGYIDHVIAARGLQAQLLHDSVASGVHAAVTGADQPNREPSRLAWATSLPANWPSVRLALIARIGTGHTPSRSRPEYWEDCDIPWLTTTDVFKFRYQQVDSLDRTEVMISPLGLANSSAVMHAAGTVALSRTSGSAGFAIIMARAMATSQDFATWTPGPRLRSEYLLWCLRAMHRDLMGRLAMGSTHLTIYFPDLLSIRVPLPPLESQDDAIGTIRSLTSQGRSMGAAMEQSITRLNELKRSLITAAVTGEFDVSSADGSQVPVA